MIDYDRVLDFCSAQKIDFEDLMLLYSLHLRNEQIDPALHSRMNEYYKRGKTNGTAYVQKAKRLRDMGFLEFLKEPEGAILEIKNLKLTDEYAGTLFIDPDEIWNMFYKRYPAKGWLDGKSFIANMLDPKGDDKAHFKKNILKNANKSDAWRILFVVEEMFDYDPIAERPSGYAKVGISKFIHNWDEILRQWEKDKEEEDTGNYKRL